MPIYSCVQRVRRDGAEERCRRMQRSWILFLQAMHIAHSSCVAGALRDAFTKIRTRVSSPSIHFLTARTHVAHSFIHRLDNMFAVTHVSEHILPHATHALRNPIAIDVRSMRVDNARVASGEWCKSAVGYLTRTEAARR